MVIAVPAHKIAYMAVPKAACSSVKAALAMIDPDTKLTLDMMSGNNKAIHVTYQTRRFRPHRWERYEGWWRFTVLRDPLKRLLSVYSDRVVARRELHSSRKMRWQKHLPLDPDPDFFFQNLREYMVRASVVKHHALPVRLFVGPKPLRYDRVFTVAQMGDLEAALRERSGTAVKIPRFNSSHKKFGLDDLSPKTHAALAEILRPEYDHLSDYFDDPFR